MSASCGTVPAAPRRPSTCGCTCPDAGDFPDTRADATVDVVIGPEFTTLATPEEIAAALAPAESARHRLLTPAPAQPACSSARSSRKGPAIDGAAATAIGSPNGRPDRPVTVRPASAATSAPAAWSQGLRSSS